MNFRASLRRYRFIIVFIAACTVVLVQARRAEAWGSSGHRIVAAIAWANMTPAARSAAIKLLMSAPSDAGIADLRPKTGTDDQRNEQWFISVATWPDLVRDGPHQKYSHPGWHFADHYWKVAGGQPTDLPSMGPADTNSAERLQAFEAELRGGKATPAQQAVDLAWILHLVGDVHQPLHNSSRVTPQLPDGDRGGNSIHLTSKLNLHSYWDDIPDIVFEADKSDHRTATQKRAYEKQPEYILNWAGQITSTHSASSVPTEEAPDFKAWSLEGLAVAKEDAYNGIQAQHAPNVAYRDRVSADASTRLAQAGYRLANLLNSLTSSVH